MSEVLGTADTRKAALKSIIVSLHQGADPGEVKGQFAALLLATIARRFHLSLVPGQQVVPEPSLTLRPKHGLKMVLRRR